MRQAIDGFTFVKEEVFECGEDFEMLPVYRHDLFAEALGLRAGDRDPVTEFVLVPGGEFRMGASEEQVLAWREWSGPNGERIGDHEQPQHRVKLEPFLVGRTTVTQAVWDGVEELTGEELWDQRNAQAGWLPVHGVTHESIAPFLELTGTRLPTEAEWEYACRGGMHTIFSFGSTEFVLKEYAWYDQEVHGGPMGVSQKLANMFGLFDVHGNVWEMCQDVFHDDYRGAPADGSAWLEGGDDTQRVIRGGSWRCSSPIMLTSVFRSSAGLYHSSDAVGFRVVASIPDTQ